MIIGIDIGGTTTDIVGFRDKKIVDIFTVTASDPVTSASGALGKFITSNNLSLSEIEKIAITGVGASYIDSNIFGVPTVKVDEFQSIGLGRTFLSNLKKAIVVSMGTGTAIVSVNGSSISHFGGTGVGGGTLLGLSKEILNSSNFKEIITMAESGDLSNVDLTIGDISQISIGNLQKTVTASNLGGINKQASKNDYALGIINLVFQSVGILSLFATKIENERNIVFTGKLAKLQLGRRILNDLKVIKSFDAEFHFPKHIEYATAIGAAISELDGNII